MNVKQSSAYYFRWPNSNISLVTTMTTSKSNYSFKAHQNSTEKAIAH